MSFLSSVVSHAREHRIGYIVGLLAALTASLFLVIWHAWLYEVLRRNGEAIPRQALGAIIGVLLVFLLASFVYVFYYKQEMERALAENLKLQTDLSASKSELDASKLELQAKLDSLEKAEQENQQLKEQVKQLSQPPPAFEPDEKDKEILRYLYKPDVDHLLSYIAETIRLDQQETKLRLHKLNEHKYVRLPPRRSATHRFPEYKLTDKGIEFVINNNLRD